jgi:hypothetical protein
LIVRPDRSAPDFSVLEIATDSSAMNISHMIASEWQGLYGQDDPLKGCACGFIDASPF